jgi:4-cresol dehydrogenase (hydroxylating) flavoprotein subunit
MGSNGQREGPAGRPRGVDEKTFARALREFAAIVGERNLSVSPAELVPYAHDVIMIPPIWPSAAVRPGSVAEVQRVVRAANRLRIPLWPVSTGKNIAYGRMMAVEPGNVVLDLARMNRILEVNEKLAYAVVEPGVTYAQLYRHLRDQNLPLWLDPPATAPGAGPLGNTVERGVGYTPYGEHFLFSCGMEVVLPDGRLLRTGSGALPGSRTWHIFKWGYGPYLDGLFTASNYGIVTRLGIWLMPEPPAYQPILMTCEREDDVVAIMDFLRPLKVSHLLPSAVVVAHALLALAAEAEYPRHLTDGARPVPEDWIREQARARMLGMWNIAGCLYGAPAVVKELTDIVHRRAAADLPQATMLDVEAARQSPYWDHKVRNMTGVPSMVEYSRLSWRGGGNAFVAPVVPLFGEEARKHMEIARPIFWKHGFDYIGEFIAASRDQHHVMMLLHKQPDEMARAAACYRELTDAFCDGGYLPYRTNVAFMDHTMRRLDPVFQAVCGEIKRALDPNEILAPGKNGIRIAAARPAVRDGHAPRGAPRQAGRPHGPRRTALRRARVAPSARRRRPAPGPSAGGMRRRRPATGPSAGGMRRRRSRAR